MERNDLNIIEAAHNLLTSHATEIFVSKNDASQAAKDLAYLQQKLSKDVIVPIELTKNVQDILSEKARAEAKHPNYDLMPLGDCVAVVSEESGEMTRAYLQYAYEEGDITELHKETIQTAATCLRLLEYLDGAYIAATPLKENDKAPTWELGNVGLVNGSWFEVSDDFKTARGINGSFDKIVKGNDGEPYIEERNGTRHRIYKFNSLNNG